MKILSHETNAVVMVANSAHNLQILGYSQKASVSETVTVDNKGRMVLPKSVREKAGIKLHARLLAEVKGPGVVELRDSTVLIRKVREVATKKLTGWKEEEHREDKLLKELAN